MTGVKNGAAPVGKSAEESPQIIGSLHSQRFHFWVEF